MQKRCESPSMASADRTSLRSDNIDDLASLDMHRCGALDLGLGHAVRFKS